MLLAVAFLVEHCLEEQLEYLSGFSNKMVLKLNQFFWILLAIFGNIVNCQYSGDAYDTYGYPLINRPSIIFTTTPGDLCKEFMGCEMAVWASYAYRTDVCIRPVSCRLHDNFIIRTRPGSPPEGMLCALYLRNDGDEAIRFVCRQGECVRE